MKKWLFSVVVLANVVNADSSQCYEFMLKIKYLVSRFKTIESDKEALAKLCASYEISVDTFDKLVIALDKEQTKMTLDFQRLSKMAKVIFSSCAHEDTEDINKEIKNAEAEWVEYTRSRSTKGQNK